MPSILTGLTDQPNQQYPITLPDGSTATMLLQFWPQQLGWFYSLTWDGQTGGAFAEGLAQLVVSPNILRQWKNVIPFGIAVATVSGLDPTDQEDFVNGNCSLFLLNPSDVGFIESIYYTGN